MKPSLKLIGPTGFCNIDNSRHYFHSGMKCKRIIKIEMLFQLGDVCVSKLRFVKTEYKEKSSVRVKLTPKAV